MRKRSRKTEDENEAAFRVVQEATGRAAEPNPRKNPAAVALGRRGGLKGGKARAAKLSKEELTAQAKKAASPIYDVAACLGAELQDAQVGKNLARPDRYVARCPSGFGNGIKLLSHAELVTALRGWPEWLACARGWLGRFQAVLDGWVRTFLSSIPSTWLPESRMELAERLLHARLE